MASVAYRSWVGAAGAVALGLAAAGSSSAATGSGDTPELLSAKAGIARSLGDSADVMLRFIQEDGPESGHVRVILTPETRPLTILEARSAAQQAFLEALKEPGLGDNLTRITVVVRLMPASHPDPSGRAQIVVFQHKSGREWTVLPGE